MKETKKDC